MDTVIEATDLTKHYEDFSLRGASLTVRKGSVSGVFGPNAAGKSTLLRMLAGQTPVPAGTLRVLDQSYADAERDLKNRVGYVPQEPVFYENKTVEWHARLAAPCFARWDGAAFHRLLEDFRVNPLKKVKHLSGGQKKLLSLALALSHAADRDVHPTEAEVLVVLRQVGRLEHGVHVSSPQSAGRGGRCRLPRCRTSRWTGPAGAVPPGLARASVRAGRHVRRARRTIPFRRA